ncbi:MAG: alpha/beta hydrolase [Acidimicrobiia bacterium]|nr:alpha/beta hydrolase [Acidimicrobiia bacterium]
MAFVQIGEHSVFYRERGSGPPVVFCHGWPLDSREFTRQLDGLSDAYRVIAWDAPGAGRSTDPSDETTLDDWADWLAELVHALDLGTIHLAGLSWGGGLALAFADRHPGLVRSLVLMSAYAGWGGSLPEDEVRRRLELTMANTSQAPEEWVPATLDTLLPPGSSSHLADELWAMLSDLHPGATRTALRAFAEADLRPALGRIDAPALLLYGDRDVRSPRAVREPIHEAIPGSTLVVLPGMGHMVDMQAPRALQRRDQGVPRHRRAGATAGEETGGDRAGAAAGS